MLYTMEVEFNKEIEFDKKIKLTVDLEDDTSGKRVVAFAGVKVIKRKSLFTRLPSDSYSLSVDWDNNEELADLVFGEGPLLFINVNGVREKTVELQVESHETRFDLFVDTAQLKDSRNQSRDTYTIPFTIALRQMRNVKGTDQKVEEKIKSGILEIKFKPLKLSRPSFEFSPNDAGSSLEYDVTLRKPFQIGNLLIKNSGNHLYCPACDIDFDVMAREVLDDGTTQPCVGLLSLDPENVCQSMPRIVDHQDPLVPIGKDGSEFSLVNLEEDEDCPVCRVGLRVDVNKLPEDSCNRNIISIPLFWDMNKASNPEGEKQRYQIYVTAKYDCSGTQSDASAIKAYYDDMSISLKRNLTIINFDVLLSDGVSTRILSSGVTGEVWKPDFADGAVTTFRLLMRNSAHAAMAGKERAKIFIKDFKCMFPVSDGNYEAVKGKVQPNLFEVKLPVPHQFALGIAESKRFEITYDHTCIKKVINQEDESKHSKTVQLSFSLSYYVDKDALYVNSNPPDTVYTTEFATTIPIEIRERPRPEWLCVDFGTSAVVATFRDHLFQMPGTPPSKPIPLKKQKESLLREWYQADQNVLNDTTELSEYMIASLSVINNVATRNGFNDDLLRAAIAGTAPSEYRTSPVLFSPSSGAIDIYSWMLPSLKALMGTKSVPKELLPLGLGAADSITTDLLFELIYKQFFQFFLPEDVKTTNKLVLTVPNTYTPSNIETLRKLALRFLPNAWKDYIGFISESDAVAFYYLANEYDFIDRTKEKTEQRIKELEDQAKQSADLEPSKMSSQPDEPSKDSLDKFLTRVIAVNQTVKNILVYDMGAGTLDLTYFTRRKSGGKTIVDIRGKMGFSKAGNYFDYLLADILVEKICEKLPDDQTSDMLKQKIMALLKLENNPDWVQAEANRLKEYVRNKLKLMLDRESSEHLPPLKLANTDVINENITVGEMLDHKKMREFLSSVSEVIFGHFKELFSTGEEPVRPDLVIFSGRSTSFSGIRKHVMEAMSVVFRSNDCLALDLAGGVFYTNNLKEGPHGQIDQLKTIVVDGALAFFSDFVAGRGDYVLKNKNVYATYGVMFKRGGSDWIWQGLIDTKTQPIDSDNAKLTDDGLTIYQYDTDVHRMTLHSSVGVTSGDNSLKRDFTSYNEAYLIQSYSSKTEDDWKAGRFELISIIGKMNLTMFSGIRKYKLSIDEFNKLHFQIGTASMDLTPSGDVSSDSFLKSIWPIVNSR